MSEFQNNGQNTVTVKVDNTVLEAKHAAEMALKEKENDDLAKELAVFKQKEAESLAAEEAKQSIPKKSANGSVPFNPPTNFDSRKGFQSYEEMTNSLRAREQTHDETAKSQMDAIYLKMLQEMKDGAALGVSGKFNPANKSLAEMFNENRRTKIRINNGILE